jgi:heme-degrading monooxygenase HmoA
LGGGRSLREPARAGNDVHVILWEFRARPGLEREFEKAYGPDGVWARFFRRGDGYLGTELHRDLSDGGRYLTIDRWRSRAAYESFRRNHEAEYLDLDRRCGSLTDHERPIGGFGSIGEARRPSGRRSSRGVRPARARLAGRAARRREG